MSLEPVSPRTTRLGLLAGFFAYLAWGLFPLYWRPLHDVPPGEILAHRIAWSLVFLVIVLSVKGQWGWLPVALKQPKVLRLFALSAALLSVNWFLYIWAVNSGRVVEASLGYFINPIVNVVLGRLVLNERLRRVQQVAIALAFIGVAWLTWLLGTPPWVSLVLACSFGLYGLLRKVAPLASLEGLTLESLLMGGPAIAYLVWLETQGRGSFGHAGMLPTSMLAGAGVMTALPLLLFGLAARRLPLSVMGVLQYLSPTLQFIIGVVVFREPFDPLRLVGFGFIWAALITYSLEGLLKLRRRSRPVAAAGHVA